MSRKAALYCFMKEEDRPVEVEMHADRDRQRTKAGEPRDSNPRVLIA